MATRRHPKKKLEMWELHPVDKSEDSTQIRGTVDNSEGAREEEEEEGTRQAATEPAPCIAAERVQHMMVSPTVHMDAAHGSMSVFENCML